MKGLVDRSKNKNNLPHMALFYEKIFQAFGGSEEFAKEFKALYDDEETRRTDKVRMMCAITGGVKDLYDRGLTENTEDEDPSLMTDEQIDAELMQMLDDETRDEGDEDDDEG